MEPQRWKPVPLEYRRPQLYEIARANTFGSACLLEPHAPRALAVVAVLAGLRCVRLARRN